MFWTTGLILALAICQVPADLVTPDYVENVRSGEDISQRIVSGWAASLGEIPYQTSLRLVNPAGGVSGCGGSVVARYWVLSAAHCTAGQISAVVRAGLVTLTTPQYIFETQEFYNHPTFNVNTPLVVQPNDISIIKLSTPVTYSWLLQPVRLQSSAEAHRNYNNELVVASGFGRTWTNGAQSEILNWVYLVGLSNSECSQVYGTHLINNAAICARFYNVTSQSTCQGDSGGPLVHVGSDGVPTLVGIASFVAGGDWGCHSGLPAGFIRPGPFLPWLEQVTGIDFENLDEEDVPTTTELPITNSTTTELPITNSTTTELPITNSTTTELPITNSTTTELPITNSTTTELPITNSTTTELPITNSTTTELPITNSTTTELPTTNWTITPTSELPTTNWTITPTTELPTTNWTIIPTTELPITNSTTTELPITNSTTTELPITNSTTTELPITNSTTTELPITNSTTTELPITNSTTTELPTTNWTITPTSELPTTNWTITPTTELPSTNTTEATVPEPPVTSSTPRPTPPTTPEPEGEESEEYSSSSSEEDDPEMSELLKKLIVKVKVKVNVNNQIKKVKVKCHDKVKA